MVNLKTGNKLRLGDSANHIFEMMPSIIQKEKAGLRQTTSPSTDASSESNVTLPIVGQRIFPKSHRERFVRPTIANQRLCRLRNGGKSHSMAADRFNTNEFRRSSSLDKKPKSKQHKVSVTPESSSRTDRWADLGVSIDSNSSLGNQLAQLIARLQNELQRKETEIVELKEKGQQLSAKNSNNLNDILFETFFLASADEINELSKR
jgi:hypothetical protein